MGDRKSSGLDAASANKILEADLKNVVAKVASGKPLTTKERDLVERATQERKVAKSVKELMALLGISKSHFYRLRGRAGAPDGRDLEEWREFLSTQRMATMNGTPLSPEQIQHLKGRLLAERTGREKVERQLKELRFEREAGGWVPLEEASDAIRRVLEPINRLLEGIPKAFAMRVNPTDPDFAEEMLREMVADLKEQISLARGGKISKRKGVK
jgi:hypothetical protein